MRYGSVCSGIEAASAAWHSLGWQPAWFAEIEAFPSAVLAHHYPDVPNSGDFTQIAGAIEAEAIEAPDVLVGGTPCQAFSVAGLRMSLADARGNLSLAFVELANAIDDLRRHRGQPAGIIVWENVPGVLSTKDNAFGCFLAGLAGSDAPLVCPAGRKWTDAGVVVGPARTVAWRTLDAQYFGLAQRRRRVFVVASARDGFDPAAVLLEFDGVRRDSAPGREAGEGVAAGTLRSTDGGSDVDHAVAGHLIPATVGTLCADTHPGSYTGQDAYGGRLIPHTAHTLRAEGFDASEDGTGRGTPLVPVHFRKSRRAANPDDHETWVSDGIANTLNCHDIGDIRAVDIVAQPVAVSVALRGRDGGAACEVGDDVAFTLRASSGGGDKPHVMAPVAFNSRQDPVSSTEVFGALGSSSPQAQAVAFAQNQRDEVRMMDVAGALAAEPGMKQQTYVSAAMQVRRLTPRECERLQGFPDDYTLVPVRGKPAADGPRYKALGNSMAVPVMRWIGARIAQQVKV